MRTCVFFWSIISWFLQFPTCNICIYSLCVGQSLSHVWLFATLMDCRPPGFSVHGLLQARIHSLLQGIFLTQGSKPQSPALQLDSLLFEPPGKPLCVVYSCTVQSNLLWVALYRVSVLGIMWILLIEVAQVKFQTAKQKFLSFS